MNYTIQDDRTPQEVESTVGFVVATDSFMSGWGEAPGRSIVAVPVVDYEDEKRVRERLERRYEMKRVRFCLKDWRPRLFEGDHLHIYDTKTSFRYAIKYN